MAPHVAKALEINNFFDPLRRKYQAVLSVIDRFRVGLGVTASSGEVIFVNELGQRCLEETNQLFLDNKGFLSSPVTDVNQALAEAVSACSSTAGGRGMRTGYEVTVPRAEAEPLLLTFAPLRDAAEEIESDFHGCLFTILDPSLDVPIQFSAVKSVYGLTSVEAEIAEQLLRGFDVEEIAELRSVSPLTVRSQIKAIFAKANVNSRHAFMWKALKLAPPLI